MLFSILKNKSWVKEYIFWELKLLEFVGYNLNLKKIEFINLGMEDRIKVIIYLILSGI